MFFKREQPAKMDWWLEHPQRTVSPQVTTPSSLHVNTASIWIFFILIRLDRFPSNHLYSKLITLKCKLLITARVEVASCNKLPGVPWRMHH